MSHQSANPGHGRDRGRDLSCGIVMWTPFIHALFKQVECTFWKSSSFVFMHTTFSMQTAGSVL